MDDDEHDLSFIEIICKSDVLVKMMMMTMMISTMLW